VEKHLEKGFQRKKGEGPPSELIFVAGFGGQKKRRKRKRDTSTVLQFVQGKERKRGKLVSEKVTREKKHLFVPPGANGGGGKGGKEGGRETFAGPLRIMDTAWRKDQKNRNR